MNRLFFNSNFINNVITGTIVTSAIVITQAPVTLAKSPTEIAAIAQATTVRIENDFGVPGGSGVIIAKKNYTYTILTANHVVENPNLDYNIQIQNTQYPVSQIHNLKNKTGLDLAIVTFESERTYSVISLGNVKYATTGANAYVSGYPLTVDINSKREHEFTKGMITSIRESASEGYTMRYDALTRRGMSGGAVLNNSGQLIGIHGQGDVIGSLKHESSSIPEPLKTGFNAAIPIKKFLDSLPAGGISYSDLVVEREKPDKPAEPINLKARKEYIAGIELLQKGDMARANEYLSKAAKQNPNNALAVYYQGLIDYTKRDLNSAIANYDRAIAANSNFSLAYFSRGLANYRLGNQQQALEDYNNALRINPVNPWSYLNRGIVREQLNDVSGALSDYNQAIKIAPDYGKSYYNRGAISYEQRNFKTAVEDFQKASEIFFRQGDTQSYNVAIDSLNKAKKALRNFGSSNQQQASLGNGYINPVPETKDPKIEQMIFGFRNAYEYGVCLDLILSTYEKNPINLERIEKNDCINSFLELFGTELSKDAALLLIDSANTYAITSMRPALYPSYGLRRRAAINLGYIYKIDQNDSQMLEYANSAH
ncbi:MAG: tetratricopeptide repeat-containing serine protease family protein [Xenococcaceae cyanobacterium MO_188.B19]|nr:tetratricopeptide repeat-containing serine protease family protein [Xenococcaceae cyanobacterium MO_188.B19]